MIEFPSGRSWPQRTLYSHESSNVLNIIRFRLECRRERKTGVVMLPFGQAFWIDEQGNYLDGKVPPQELELEKLFAELNTVIVDGDACNECSSQE